MRRAGGGLRRADGGMRRAGGAAKRRAGRSRNTLTCANQGIREHIMFGLREPGICLAERRKPR
jgi:hypothetical protein